MSNLDITRQPQNLSGLGKPDLSGVDHSLLPMVAGDPARMPAKAPGVPDVALIVELEMRLVNGAPSFDFVSGSTRKVAHDFPEILKGVAGGKGGFFGPIKKKGEHPLSLCNDQLAYIVVRLGNENWRFAEQGDPMTLAEGDPTLMHYGECRRVNSEGQIVQADESSSDCRVAFFVCDGKTLTAGDQPYSTPYTLRTQFLQEGGSVPVDIDPSVEWPKGTQP